MKQAVSIVRLAFAVAAVLSAVSQAWAQASKPNVVFIWVSGVCTH